jgi:tetratricopeptide (TPR) repeat protein
MHIHDKNLLKLVKDTVGKHDMDDILFGMSSVLDNHQFVPPEVVGEIHSLIGQIHLKQHNSRSAVSSLLKALWMQRTFLTTNDGKVGARRIAIAKTEHRLGLAYGKNGDYPNAIRILKMALSEYEMAGVSICDMCCSDARESLAHYQEAEQLEKLPKKYGIKRSGKLPRRHLSC